LLTTVTDPLSHAASTGYDALDRKISTTDKRGAITDYAYDNTGNLVQVTDLTGGISTFSCDNNANRLTETDPLGNTTTYAYDALNRVYSKTDPLGNMEMTGYDNAGRVVSRTNANNQTTQFGYDPLGRLLTVIDPSGGTVDYAYDNVGNRISMTEPNGNTTTYAYDALNRRIAMTEPLGNTTTYSYDAVGNLYSMTDPNGKTTTYSYDNVNRLSQVVYWDASSVQFYHDQNGNRIQMNDGIGISTYSYDALNRMISATDGFNKSLGYAYDNNSNLTLLTYPDGKQVQYAYDSLNRMETVTDWQSRTTTYVYDTAGRLAGTINPNGTTAAYGYDAASRLTGLANRKSDDTVISSYAYTLDPLGNHLQVTQTEPLSSPLPLTKNIAYTYDTENRLVSAGPTPFTYDYNGNMLTKGSDTFAYDPANRLSSSTIGGVSSTYRYDGTGNRLERVAGGVTTRFIQDINRSLPNVLAETDGSGSITSYYVYGLGLVSKVLPDETAYYYNFDSRGSTVALTDTFQNVTDSYAYGPFGEVLATGGASSNPFRYLGRYGVADDGNGSLQIRARYYLPGAGRFITKDPADASDTGGQGLNKYVYAMNNPFILVDISGFSPQDVTFDAQYNNDKKLRDFMTIGTEIGTRFAKWGFLTGAKLTMRSLSGAKYYNIYSPLKILKDFKKFTKAISIISNTNNELNTQGINLNLSNLIDLNKYWGQTSYDDWAHGFSSGTAIAWNSIVSTPNAVIRFSTGGEIDPSITGNDVYNFVKDPVTKLKEAGDAWTNGWSNIKWFLGYEN
jgi:RHS repeat-associated protein